MKKIGLFFLMSVLMASVYSSSPVQKGEKVPDFQAMDDQGKTWKLSDQRDNYLVIYFYPAAFTGGCTKQACAYRDHQEEFALLGASIIGISGDQAENLTKFKKYNKLNFTLISDQDGKIAGIFGVPVNEGKTIEKEVDGQTLNLSRNVTTARWTFVVDNNGKLIYRDDKVAAETDPETVLKAISTHNARKTCKTF